MTIARIHIHGTSRVLLAFILGAYVASSASAQLDGALDKAKDLTGSASGEVGATLPTAAAPTGGLVGMLTQKLGVTEPQATGGAGAIFSLAKSKLSAGEFSQIAAGVPSMDSLLAAAPAPSAAPEVDTGAAGGLAGSALGAMGGSAGSLGSAAQLASSFSSFGLSADMVGKFIPVCAQYVQATSGAGAASLLTGALQ